MVRGNRITDELAQHLRDRILTGAIAGGTQLAEQNIASEYDVARPTARSAMALLHDDGLVTLHPHLPATVSLIPVEALPEIIRLLEVTEELALDALGADDPDLRPLRPALSESAHAFLDTMVEISASQRLIRVHRRSTFELLLAEIAMQPTPIADDSGALHDLMQALLMHDHHGAAVALTAVQQNRRATLSVPFAPLGPAAPDPQ